MGIFNLFRTWLGFGDRKSRARRRTEISKTEALEVRRMLTVTPTLVGTTLTVAGTGADTIDVVQDVTGTTITWDGGGANTHHYAPATTINTINVTAGTGGDTITIDGVLNTTTLTVDGGTSFSTLVSPTLANTWDITGTDAGTLNGQSFQNINSLTGGSADDSFVFMTGGTLDGTIDGGSGGANTLDYSNTNVGISVDLSADTASYVGSGYVDGTITNIIGSSDTTDALTGANIANTWTIDGTDSGSVNDDLGNPVTFSGIKNLNGGTSDNSFVFMTGGSLDGQVNGGTGGTNTLDYSNTTVGITVDLGADAATYISGGFVDGTINNIVGSTDTTDTLIGAGVTNTWTINGVDSGSVNDDVPNLVTFSGIKNLVGGSSDDTFTFMDGGSIDGSVDGGAGNNTLDYSNLSTAITANLQANTATSIGTTFTNIQTIVGTGLTADVLVGSDSNNEWDINGIDSGSVTNSVGTVNYQNIANLTGGALDDNFVFMDGGSVSGQITDAAGNNTLDFSQRSDQITVNLNTMTATPIIGGFSGIQNLVGNDPISDTIIGADASNAWNITGANSGDINGTTFTGFNNLTGGSLDDTFTFGASGSISGTIDGGSDTNNTIVAANQANTWTISGADSGDVNGNIFVNIQNLTGGAFNDNFVFMPTGYVQGVVDGGGGLNALDYSNLLIGVTVNLQNNTATDIGGGFANVSITDLNGSFDTTDTLIGTNTSNVWTIDGTDSGNLNGTFYFTGVENLVGGSLDDTFAFQDGGSVEGTINGGAGNNTIDYSAVTTAVTANLNANESTGIGTSYTNIQNMIGTGLAGDVIIGDDYNNVWNVTGANSGSVTNSSESMNFQNFNNLTGGALNDVFVFTDSGSVGGTVDGSAGSNTLNFTQRSDSINVNLQSLTVAPIIGGFSGIQSFVGNAPLNDTITGANVNNTWNITSGNTGTVNGISFIGFNNLVGGTANDSFAFSPTGFVSGQISGGTGANTLDYSAVNSGIVTNLQTNSSTDIGAGFNGIQTIIGANKGDDLLIGNNANSTWNINNNAGNAGTVTFGPNTITFSGIGNLRGGSGNDTFAFATGGYVTGTIFGGAGYNTLDYSAEPGGITVNLQNNTASAIGSGFASIQNFVFPVDPNTLIGPNTNNVWNITGGNSGNLNGTFFFNNVDNIVGGSLNDVFRFSSTGFLSGYINGSGGNNTVDYSQLTSGVTVNLQTGISTDIGGGISSIQNLIGTATPNDTLIGANAANSFNITSADSGNVNSQINFTGFENLTGGTLNDAFVFAPGGFVHGNISGGAGSNTLDYSGLTSGITTNLQANSSTNIGGTFSGIQNIIGANHGDDVLTGANYTNLWDIKNSNAGTVTSTINNQPVSTNFSGIANLIGGTGNDTFRFENGGSLSGSINGRNGLNALDYSNLGIPATVNLQNNTTTGVGGTFASIQGVIGNNAVADKIIGLDVGNTWQITGANTGFVNSNFGFTNVSNLTGGLGVDIFSLMPGGSITGTVDGGTVAGGDWLDYSAITTNVSANLATGVVTGIAHIANIQNVHGGSGSNTLTGNALGNVLVGGAGTDTITGGSGRSVLIGGLGADTVKGGAGQDIVIAGYTNYDSNFAALGAILAEWQSSNTLQVRVNHLRNGGGLNKNYTLVAGTTVHNDGTTNAIYGGAGPNWLWGQPAEFKDKTAQDITDSPIDNAITVSGAGTAVYTISQPAVQIDPSITISSAANNTNSLTLSYATIQLTTNYMANQDNLTFSKTSATGNIVGVFNSATGIMTLSSAGATATIAQFQAAIRLVQYSNSALISGHPFQPSMLPRGVQTQVFDGTRFSNTVIGTLALNTAPTLAGTSTLKYTTGQGAAVINGGINITDPDSTRLAFATVAITVGYNKNQDRLVFVSNPALTADIVGTFNVNTGIMTLTTAGSIPATLAQYQAALRLVQYQNIAAFPFKGQRVITYQVSDGAGLSNKLTSSITFN